MSKTSKKKGGKKAKTTAGTKGKYVYYFGDGKADGDGTMKALLGGKGANLGEMTRIGLPVPCGFTISTEVCTYYYDPSALIRSNSTGRSMLRWSKWRNPWARNSAAWRTHCWWPSAPARVIPCRA